MIIALPLNGFVPFLAFVAAFFITFILTRPGRVKIPGAFLPERFFFIIFIQPD